MLLVYVGKYIIILALLQHTEPFHITKCDEIHSKNRDILQYEIFWGHTLQLTCTFV